MSTRSYQSIGEVLVSVKTEFPDITISKIRFLESEGLIEPERTPSGYRKFYDKDVDRLKQILRMQRDEYLPLKVIKDRLLTQETGPGEGLDDREAVGTEFQEELAEPPTGLQMSIDEMSTATGIDKERIKELESFGLVSSHGPDSAKYYDGDDYVVAADRVLGVSLDYGRVDMMRLDDGTLAVSELEVTEPGLYLDILPENAGPFADLVTSQLG